MNSKDTLNHARRLYRSGELDEAERICRQLLQKEPNHPEALYLMGTLAGQRGDTDGAIDLLRRSIRIKGDVAESHQNLGILLARRERYDEAISEFEKAAALNPGFTAAHVSLGDALSTKGLLDAALSAYDRAARLTPNLAEVHNNIGKLLFKKGQYEEAIAAHLRAVGLKPNFALAYYRLGHAYRAIGDRRLEDALSAYRRAVQLKPDLVAAYLSMAVILADALRFDEAMECHARAAELRPDAARTHEAMGVILLRQRGAAAAVEHFRRAVEIDRNLFSSWNFLGVALQAQGLFDEAQDCFRQMLASRPDSVLAHGQLVSSSRKKGSQREIDPLSELLRRPDLTTEQRISAEFAIATALDDAERFDEAFGHLSQANLLAKQRRALAGDHYEPDAFHGLIQQLIETFTPEFFEKRRGWGDPSDVPVFVVGMPRSGTTLVHQIAASHPKVRGAGELNHIAYILNALERNGSNASPVAWSAEAISEAAHRHLQFLGSLDENAARVVDKLPRNLHHLGLIALLFPSARVVLCRRDPRDTCLSCYFQGFDRGNAFSFDLAHCGHYQLENDRLMAHWLRVLPLFMLEVQYEKVVEDLEGESRRLIDFLGLPWDPGCLQFDKAQTTVLTSSIWQIRQPIYNSSVGRWRHYEQHLGPLLKSLGL